MKTTVYIILATVLLMAVNNFIKWWKRRNLIRMCNKLLDENDRLLAKARKKGLLP